MTLSSFTKWLTATNNFSLLLSLFFRYFPSKSVCLSEEKMTEMTENNKKITTTNTIHHFNYIEHLTL